MMPTTATTTAATKPYAFGRTHGPVPGTWVVTLSCPHGMTRCYLAARRLELPGEGVAILELLAAQHHRARPWCRCLGHGAG